MTWWYQLEESVRSVMWYARTVWKHRWWDYGYQLVMIDRMLEECEKNWVKDTHHLGDAFTLGRIKVVRKHYRQYSKAVGFKEEDKYLQLFMSRYARLMTRLWD